jgi:Ni/Co efflux regulator RcnB
VVGIASPLAREFCHCGAPTAICRSDSGPHILSRGFARAPPGLRRADKRAAQHHCIEKGEHLMHASTIVSGILAATFGVSSLAIAQDGGRRGDRDHGDQRAEQRHDRQERRENRAERREERRDDRREWRAERRDDRRDDRREDRAYRHGYNAGYQHQPAYTYNQPSYTYNQPGYRQHAPRFQRGGYLPHEYRNRGHYVNDWRAHRGLYAPPHGHQWMQVDNDFVLVALATGLIANLLMQ